MGGSLRIPASFCNIVGYRPSIGVVPAVPTRNAWAWLSRTGLMARSVEDIALGMTAIAGSDAAVPYAYPVRESFADPLERDRETTAAARRLKVRVAVLREAVRRYHDGEADRPAEDLAPGCVAWWAAGHRSTEPAQQLATDKLGLVPLLDLGLRLGEGSGAVAALPLVRSAALLLSDMALLADLT